MAGAAALAAGVPMAASAASAVFSVGSGKAEINLPSPVDGFATVNDPLYVRVLLLQQGTTSHPFVSIDLTSLDGTLLTEWATLAAQIVGCAVSDVLVYAAHNFSSPHVFAPANAPPTTDLPVNAAAVAAITSAVQTATTLATQTLVPAKVGQGTGPSKLAVNRNENSANGYWLGFDDTLFSDPLFSVLRFDNEAGDLIAVIVNVAVQPSVMQSVPDASGAPVISADLAGQVVARIEATYGAGVTALFLPGADGDQAPVFKGSFNIFPPGGEIVVVTQTQSQANALLHQMGGRLHSDVLQVLGTITTTTPSRFSLHSGSVNVFSITSGKPTGPVTSIDYVLGPLTDIPYIMLVIGEAVVVGTWPELSAILGAAIRRASPFKGTLVGVGINGGAKYLPDLWGYEHFTYEAQEAQFAPGSGEIFVEQVAAALQRLG